MQQAIQSYEEEINRVFFGKQKPKLKQVDFVSWADTYLQNYSSENESFKPDQSRMKILKEFFKDKDLRAIMSLDVQKFRKSRIRKGNSEATCNRYISLIKRMLNTAIDEELLDSNPVKVKQFKEPIKPKRILISEEEEKILSVASPMLRSILIVGSNCGLRTGQIYKLSWSQVDFHNRILTIEKAKNGKARSIPINETLFDGLLHLKRNSSSPYVFFNAKTKKPITTVRNSWLRACKKAGVSGVSLYSATRHTFGTKLAQRGVDVKTIAELMGHSDIQMTMRYLHTTDQRKRSAVDLLDSRLGMRVSPADTHGKKSIAVIFPVTRDQRH